MISRDGRLPGRPFPAPTNGYGEKRAQGPVDVTPSQRVAPALLIATRPVKSH